jgi:DNA-binding CsgD family transcriptional regulator
MAHTGEQHPSKNLSPREIEVIIALSGKKSKKEIARQLGIARRTVYFHLAAAKEKLGASNEDLLLRAHELGIIG